MLSDVVYISKKQFFIVKVWFQRLQSTSFMKNLTDNNKQDELFHIITMFIDAISQLYVHENT